MQAIVLTTTNRLKLTLHCLRGNLRKTVPKHTKARRLYKVFYILKDRNTRVFQSKDGFPKESGIVSSP